MIELILGATWHFLPGDWNETHPAIRFEEAPYMGAPFVNSEGNPSAAIGLIGRAELFDVLLFGEVGLATGYSVGALVPFLRAGAEGEFSRFWIAPAATTKGKVGAVAGLDIIAVRF